MKLITKEVAERLKSVPLYSTDGEGSNAEVLVRFSIPNVAEYLVTEAEEQPDGSFLMFSYGEIHFAEWGYIHSDEIENLILPDGTRFNCIIYNGKTVQEVYDEIQEEKRQREERSEEEEER